MSDIHGRTRGVVKSAETGAALVRTGRAIIWFVSAPAPVIVYDNTTGAAPVAVELAEKLTTSGASGPFTANCGTHGVPCDTGIYVSAACTVVYTPLD